MLGSDLISHANYGHMMVRFAQYTSNEAESVEAETERVLASVYEKNAPGIAPNNASPVEQSSFAHNPSFKEESEDPTKEVGPDGKMFTPEEEKEIEELEDRDAEVKRHEQAHFQAGGRYANTPKYEFQTGPDGKRYAVGGSVDIDLSEVANDPQATLEKARVIKRAALAPEDPSAQDRKVAREADQMAAQAQRQISEKQSESSREAVPGLPESNGNQSANPLQDAAAGVVAQVATESLKIDPGQNFTFDSVNRYKTSRLQMSSVSSVKMETLASPSQGTFFRGQGLSFDRYA